MFKMLYLKKKKLQIMLFKIWKTYVTFRLTIFVPCVKFETVQHEASSSFQTEGK